MSAQPRPDAESVSPSLLERIDELCDRFENAWIAGQRPALEDYLGGTAEPSRSLLLFELLGLELQYRGQNGEVFVAEDYVARFPAHAHLVREVFAEDLSEERSSVDSLSEHLSNTKPEGKKGEVDRPERLGRYRITGTVGSGSFGIVYKGYDDELRREVAIKVPHRHRVSQPENVDAYLAEARVLASLDHPHIVPVYDAGRIGDNLCFVVSKFIEGSDLRIRMKEARPSVRESAELVATVAEALHSAHERRLVHRDLKPANILLDGCNKPYLTDFGLALREEDLGRGALVLGTPAYMSPEQANGEGHLVDGRSDIFSLGVVFYELLTGRRPFVVSDDLELLRLILSSTEVCPPRQLDATIPRELERICLKALAKRASERYTTAFDLADDLHHWLAKTAMAAHDSAVYLKAPLKIVPKGLRSFDAQDTDFFLELLPGPRDREGLPDSIRFWKTRNEETDPDQTFTVGLIYGPSGCGKSSLVKAGLLPRLSQDITPLYIESTANETESRLLNTLRKRFPTLPDHLDLRATLAALRRGQGLPAGKKALIILDQFEQWLHANREEPNTELVQALRQCDGGRVQCIIMVRDDFWLAVSRFVRDLEVELVPGRNIALVDLFDPDHAKKVLAAFGRAFGKLPENSSETSKEQKEFLNQAIAGLSQDNKVICVRLALFAEMMKGKPWTPASLREVGGTAGVGVTFLEDTFSSPTANPEHRLHQQAARAVLKALLPEAGTNIRGNMRSEQELLEASGYRGRSREFADLIRILDGEIRLITPTDPEGSEEREAQNAERRGPSAPRSALGAPPSPKPTALAEPGERYYQLTHDYLVHSLRDWLTRKQRETRRGRAELLLADRASAWHACPEARELPSLLQWLQIRALVPKKDWTRPQRKMMRKATRYHALRALVAVVLLVLVGWGVYEADGRMQADSLLARLLNADTNEVPAIVQDMTPYRPWLDPLLYGANASAVKAGDRRKQLHTSLALLPVDASQLDYLYERLLDTQQPGEVLVLRDGLGPYREQLVDKLWAVMEAPGKEKKARRLQAAAALAKYDPDSQRWARVKDQVVASMVGVQPYHLERWMEALWPIRAALLDSLSIVHRDRDAKRDPSERTVATNILAEYAADRPRLLADLLMDSDEKQFPYLYLKLKEHGEAALTLLEEELHKPLEGIADAKAEEKLAKRKANAAVAVLRMGRPATVWPMLKHSADPTVRSYLIDRLGPLGADPSDIIEQLLAESDLEIRRALIQTLGQFTDAQLPPSERSELIEKLFAVYAEDSDAGIHAAAEWLLRTWGDGERVKTITDRLRAAEVQPQEGHHAKPQGPQWHVNGEGQTMVVLPGPVQFLMGSRSRPRLVRIDRTFAIGAKAVTVREFRRHRPDHRLPSGSVLDSPVQYVTWYQATAYCNWLSKQEGLPESEWCYEPLMDPHPLPALIGSIGLLAGPSRLLPGSCGLLAPICPRYVAGMKLAPNYLQRTGYRLPTEAEMEFAIRAGATTSRFYGEPDELLVKYAWFAPNSVGRLAPVGRLKPNDFGLFDMHGSVWCWCLDPYREYPRGETGQVFEDRELELTIDPQPARVVRGGCYTDRHRAVSSASRYNTLPGLCDNIIGFRLARTIARN